MKKSIYSYGLILGILSIIFTFIFCIIGIILGVSGIVLNATNKEKYKIGGGLTLSIIGLSMSSVLYIVLLILHFCGVI